MTAPHGAGANQANGDGPFGDPAIGGENGMPEYGGDPRWPVCPRCPNRDLTVWADDPDTDDADYWECTNCGAHGTFARDGDPVVSLDGLPDATDRTFGTTPAYVTIQRNGDSGWWIVDIHNAETVLGTDTSSRVFSTRAAAREFATDLAALLILPNPFRVEDYDS